MLTFLRSLGVEFAARRRRLRQAIGDRRASLLEFALLGGVIVGVAAPSFAPRNFVGGLYGPLLPLAAVGGYLLLEAGRQRLIAAGAEEAAIRAAFDRRTLYFLVALALIGFGTLVWAVVAPPPFELVPEEPPADALPVTIGPA